MDVTAMPEVVGDAGVLIDSQDPRPSRPGSGARSSWAPRPAAARASVSSRVPDGAPPGRASWQWWTRRWREASAAERLRTDADDGTAERLSARCARCASASPRGLLDLGALIFELHRQGRREPELLQAKAAELAEIDDEVRAAWSTRSGAGLPGPSARSPTERRGGATTPRGRAARRGGRRRALDDATTRTTRSTSRSPPSPSTRSRERRDACPGCAERRPSAVSSSCLRLRRAHRARAGEPRRRARARCENARRRSPCSLSRRGARRGQRSASRLSDAAPTTPGTSERRRPTASAAGALGARPARPRRTPSASEARRSRPRACCCQWPAGVSAYTVVLVTTGDRPAAARLAREAASPALEAGLMRSDDYGPRHRPVDRASPGASTPRPAPSARRPASASATRAPTRRSSRPPAQSCQ